MVPLPAPQTLKRKGGHNAVPLPCNYITTLPSHYRYEKRYELSDLIDLVLVVNSSFLMKLNRKETFFNRLGTLWARPFHGTIL